MSLTPGPVEIRIPGTTSAFEVPRQQLIDVLLFVAIDNGNEDAGQVVVRLGLVQFADLDR